MHAKVNIDETLRMTSLINLHDHLSFG